jgi:flavin-dependent thymidylate synthase
MKVSLVSYTPNALDLLLFTKHTRLSLSPDGLTEVMAWPQEKKDEQLAYMMNTIKSSFEFVDYVFTIEDVTRAFTHQLVRHRVGTSFAQQSQRTVDMSNFKYVTPDAFLTPENQTLDEQFSYHMRGISCGYEDLIRDGAAPEDARGILPTNICTNIVFKANLRTLSQMCSERLCVKAQGEFQKVMREIRNRVTEVHSWAEPLLRVHCAQTGVCCFPSVTNCKIKDATFDPATGARYDGSTLQSPLTKEHIQTMWVGLDGELKK